MPLHIPPSSYNVITLSPPSVHKGLLHGRRFPTHMHVQTFLSGALAIDILRYIVSTNDEQFYGAKIAQAIQKDPANVHRLLQKFVAEDFVLKKKDGQRIYYTVNTEHPFYKPLCKLFQAESGKPPVGIIITQEGDVALFPIQLISDGFADARLVENGFCKEVIHGISEFENGYLKHFSSQQNWTDAGKRLLEQFRADPSLAETVSQHTRRLRHEVEECKKDPTLSDSDAIERLLQLGLEIGMWGYPPVAMETETGLLSSCVEDIVASYLPADSQETPTTAANVLLAHPELTESQQYRIELLDAVLRVQEGANKETEAAQLAQKWSWLTFGYTGPGLTPEAIMIEIDENVDKGQEEIVAMREELLRFEDETRQKRETMMNQLQMEEKDRTFISATALISWLKFYRKEVIFMVIEQCYKRGRKYAKTISDQAFQYLTKEELLETIRAGEPPVDENELRERHRYSIYLTETGAVLTGQEARDHLATTFSQEEADETLKLLQGQTASLGDGKSVSGVVKILRDGSNIDHVQEGDILVAPATIPSMVPAMKRAAAIVTDVGGITSHAAIVSRELNKPCVIGTKYATKIFKDGDRVTVCPRHSYIQFQ